MAQLFPLLTAYLDHLTHVKRYSAHTVAAYARDLGNFLQFIQTHRGQSITAPLLAKLDAQDMQAFLAHRKLKENCTASTLNRQLAAIRTWFKWLKPQGISNDKLIATQNLRTASPSPKTLSEADTFVLLEKAAPPAVNPQQASLSERRNFLLLMVLYGLGLRISEALALTREDVLHSQLTLSGKGGKDRTIAIPDAIQSAIHRYLNATHMAQPHAPLFPNAQGKPLTPRSAQRVLKKLREDLNLPEHLTPHALRHSFATHLLHGGADLRTVQELLGHSSLGTTQRYLAADTDYLIRTHRKAHPLEAKAQQNKLTG